MSFAHLFPPFSLDRILYEDDDLIVIDKPVNVSTHAPDADKKDDAVSRLKLALAERDRASDPEAVYLGIHQRLDRDTSGVLLFTKQKSANSSIAAQFEGRTVRKTYVAGIVGWPGKLEKGVLTHALSPADGGRMRVVPGAGARRAPGSKPAKDEVLAVTRYQVTRRVGPRALCEMSPETGRTHQIRVQIAEMGGQIAGDPLYAKEPAARLMLHAAKLALVHPKTGAPLEVSAPIPLEFESWLNEPEPLVLPGSPLFDPRLETAIDARYALGSSADTTAFRLVHWDGDGLEGFAVDIYGEHLLVHLFSDAARAKKEDILDRMYALGCRGVYVKDHPKQSNTLVDPRIEALAPAGPVRGEPARDPFVIFEKGLAYRIRLGDGLKTGIFLDQRENRSRVKDLARGKRVLNLFAYTCGFTVAAAAGGAQSTCSVDASKGILAWGAENLEENGLGSEAHTMIDDDVFVWLSQAKKRNERFDLVVLDPPSYATTKTSRFSAVQDLPELAGLALSVLASGGRMIACTNHRGITTRKFRKQMHEAGRVSGRTIVQLKDLPSPADFPSPSGTDSHLKSVLITVD